MDNEVTDRVKYQNICTSRVSLSLSTKLTRVFTLLLATTITRGRDIVVEK